MQKFHLLGTIETIGLQCFATST